MRPIFLLIALAALGFFGRAHADASGYQDELVERAQQLKLDRDPRWHRLMHYKPRRLGSGVVSAVDFPGFFLAPTGKTDPRAELRATLASFFSEEQRVGEPAQCRARARYHWLKERLDFDPARLPEQVCERFEEWGRGLNAQALAVVFASNDLHGPSSMFGHSLLRIDARGQDDDDRLLAYAVNYAANTGANNGMSYAVRGLTGSFSGTFSIYPYYEKVKEYARFEHRDLWEYPLSLSAEETERLLEHLWELRGVEFDYYFFTENCSYQLLALIEVARPDLKLTRRFDGFPPYSIPIETVRELRAAGVLGDPVYRVALAHQLQFRIASLPASQRDWTIAYAAGSTGFSDARYTAAEPVAHARMLEIAQDQLYFLFQSGRVERQAGLQRSREVLLERSKIDALADFAPAPRPASSPDLGHGSGRISAGIRFDDERSVGLLRVRPAYHDRLDPPAGYLAGGEIEFLDIGLLADSHGVDLDSARILSVQAVSPRDAAFRPWSWQVSTGVRRYGFAPLRSGGSQGGYLDGGGGLAWAPWSRTQIYAFAFSEIDANRGIDKGYAIAAGLRSGAAFQWSDRFTQQLEADVLGGVAGAADPSQRLRFGSQYQFSHQFGLRLGLTYSHLDDTESTTVDLQLHRYF